MKPLQTTNYALRTRCASRGRACRQAGVTLIDTLVGTALLLVIFLGVVGTIRLALDVVTNNKARAGAIALANERVEYIRSLAYEEVGTAGGIPTGDLEQSESITLNGVSYTRRTFIQYMDDPADGVGAADTTGITADYKVVKVDLAWTTRVGDRHITLVSHITSRAGMEITCTPCGTLRISVVDALGGEVPNATVTIVNASTSINLTTYTNEAGEAVVIGTPEGSGYQVVVSKAGYSAAQTYGASVANTDPNPLHLTVANAQTTSGTFAIDLVGTKVVQTLSQLLPDTWTDSFATADYIATSTNAEIAGGTAHLAGAAPYPSSGFLISSALAPADLKEWKRLVWSATVPGGTSARYRVYDDDSDLIPDSVLSGNAAGFTSSPIDLSDLSVTTYPAIRVGASLVSDGAETPSIDSWSVDYTYGAAPISYVEFTMRGAKTIGTGPGGYVYKYDEEHSSGSLGSVSIPNFEWDTYTIGVPISEGYDVAASCDPQPETFPVAGSNTTRLYLAPHTTHSLLVDVRSLATGELIADASVRLTRAGYDTTTLTDDCGQAFFGGLTSQDPSYTITVTAGGYTTHANNDLPVDETTRYSVSLDI